MMETEDMDEECEVHLKKSDVFVPYTPFSDGVSHPSPLVEASSLSFTKFPQVSYVLRNPDLNKKLSAAQLDAVIMACAAHEIYLPSEVKKGFYIGDSTGVGKGREIAGIISENYRSGRLKSIWISCSAVLIQETVRDINAVDNIVPVIALPEYGEKFSSENGVLFTTYATLNCSSRPSKSRQEIIYRYDQIVAWLGDAFDGVIILDECHKAKNYSEKFFSATDEQSASSSTKTGEYVVKLQEKFPMARILYVSATGVSEIAHLQYMKRLGLFGPNTRFPTFQKFFSTLNNCGISSLELFGIEMKIRGVYIARQLSYDGVIYKCLKAQCPVGFEEMYERLTLMWALAYSYLVELTRGKKFGVRTKKSTFWSMQQRFFASIITSSKVPSVVNMTRELIKKGKDRKTVIIGLQSTGEAQYRSSFTKEPYSQAKMILYHTLTKVLEINLDEDTHCDLSDESDSDSCSSSSSSSSVSDSDSDSCSSTSSNSSGNGSSGSHPRIGKSLNNENKEKEKGEEFCKIWSPVFTDIRSIKDKLIKMYRTEKSFPRNVIDDVIDRVGGPNKIAELSGRVERQISDNQGGYTTERIKSKRLASTPGLSEYESLMTGQKYAAILTEAFSTGTSLHSNPYYKNKTKRVHITMELPWGAEKLLQQFGRTHRSNQITPPEYITYTSIVPSECRFISSSNERIKQLGAITHGDRSALPGHQTAIDYNSMYARDAIFELIQELLFKSDPDLRYLNYAFNAVGLFTRTAKGKPKANLDVQKFQKFYNRMLGLPIWVQERIFNILDKKINEKIEEAVEGNRYDEGVKDFDLGKLVKSQILENYSVQTSDSEKITLVTIAIDRSLDWPRVLGLLHKVEENWMFFRKSNQILVCHPNQGGSTFSVYKPNSINPEEWLKRDFANWTLCQQPDASELWIKEYLGLQNICLHTFENSAECKIGKSCQYGRSVFQIYILTGCLHGILYKYNHLFKDILLTRILLKNGDKIIGIKIPKTKVENVKKAMVSYADNSTSTDTNIKKGKKRKFVK